MPHCQLDTAHTRKLNKRKRFFNRARHGFFDQHIDTLVEQVRRDFKMQVGRHHHCHQIRPRLFDHLAIIAVARYMKATHCLLQTGLVRFRHTHNVNLLLVEILEYPQMVHPHRTCTDHGDFQAHKARTSCTIVVRSSMLSAGWTGSDNTCFAASSVTGKHRSAVVLVLAPWRSR